MSEEDAVNPLPYQTESAIVMFLKRRSLVRLRCKCDAVSSPLLVCVELRTVSKERWSPEVALCLWYFALDHSRMDSKHVVAKLLSGLLPAFDPLIEKQRGSDRTLSVIYQEISSLCFVRVIRSCSLASQV